MTEDIDIKTKTEEESISRTYAIIGDDNKVRADTLLKIIRGIYDTDGFFTGLASPSTTEKEILNTLKELGCVKQSYSAGWYACDREKLEEIYKQTFVEAHDDVSEVDIDQHLR